MCNLDALSRANAIQSNPESIQLYDEVSTYKRTALYVISTCEPFINISIRDALAAKRDIL